MKISALTGILLIAVGLMVVPFFKDTIGRLMVYALVGGGVVLLVILVILGVVLIAFRGD